MGVNSASFLAFVLYLLGASLQYLNLSSKLAFPKMKCLLVGFGGVLLHSYALYRWIDTPLGQNLSLSHLFSLICWLIAFITLTVSLLKPLENLSIFILPATALSILVALIFPGQNVFQTRLHPHTLMHILISILAFGALGLAALQATLLYLHHKLLRNKSAHTLVWMLPPLQTMETLLFQIIWFGFLLLSASLSSAFLFLDEPFAANRLQKIILSLLAWGLFAILLCERHQSGVRGLKKAIRWTLIGVGLLLVAYLGSKFVPFGT